MGGLKVFLFFLFIRLASVLLVQTWYVPDEYYQSLEVAHNLVFGYGHLTWEWRSGIRSYVYSLFIALLYKVLRLLNMDTAETLIFLPRVFQAGLSAYADLCFYRWSGMKKWAVFSISTSWFWFYTGSRTIINSLETALTVISLSKYPWVDKNSTASSSFLWIVACICAIRPTATIQWLPLCLYHLSSSTASPLNLIIKRYLPIGIIVLTLSTLIDSWAHGSVVVTSYEFLKSNVFNNVGEFYGTHPWHWYLLQGFPAVLGIHLLPFILSAIKVLKNRQVYRNEFVLLGSVAFTIAVYSFLPHKEFRFILPVLPIALYLTSNYLARWSRKANKFLVWIASIAILIGNVIPIWYLGVVHQRGTIDVMEPLREIAVKNPSNSSFLFLMPCHSTPLYSHLHVNVTTRLLTCLPNLSKLDGYVSESDVFYNNPNQWLRAHYPRTDLLPSHIICFDSLAPFISDLLNRYKPITRLFHSSLPSERYVMVLEKIGSS